MPGKSEQFLFGSTDKKVSAMLWPNSEIYNFKSDDRITDLKTYVNLGTENEISKRTVKFIKFLSPHKNKVIYRILSKMLLKMEGRRKDNYKSNQNDHNIYISFDYKFGTTTHHKSLIASLDTCNTLIIEHVLNRLESDKIRGLKILMK